MGKDAKRSTKKIWNLRGSEKLKFYCQMCQKQCRDKEGFNNHCTSEGHHQMMKLFSENEEFYTEKFSKEFEKDFLDCLNRKFPNIKVSANHAYNEFINEDNHHTHLNSTKWTSLNEFIGYLGKNAICQVEESQQGFTIKFIKRDENEVKKLEEKKEKEKKELNYEERKLKQLERQIQAAKELEEKLEKEKPKVVKETSVVIEDQPIKMVIKSKESNEIEEVKPIFDLLGNEKVKGDVKKESSKRKVSNLDLIKEEEEKNREKKYRKDYWLHKNIIVKIIEKGKYYKMKGIILQVIDNYEAEVEILETKDFIRVHQNSLETVIPNIGGDVLIVNGAYRGEVCILESVNIDKFNANLKSTFTHEIIKNVPYEDFSKYKIS